MTKVVLCKRKTERPSWLGEVTYYVCKPTQEKKRYGADMEPNAIQCVATKCGLASKVWLR